MSYENKTDESFELELTPRKFSNLPETVLTGYVREENVKHYSVVDRLRKLMPKGEKYIFQEDAKSKLKPLRGVSIVTVVAVLVLVVILLTVLLVIRDNVRDETAGQAEPLLENLKEARAGGWGSWSFFSDCSQICGSGSQYRLRWCDSPTPDNGGRLCDGQGKETRSCNTEICPVDGVWGIWSNWDTCTATCNDGMQTRDRVCTWPEPVHGQNCTEAKTETQICRSAPCPVDGQWGQWNAWGRCSTSCDTGTKMRYRDCVYNGTGPHGADCSGSDQETSFCSINACPVDGIWTQWTNWGACSVTCASGIQERSRTCSYPYPVLPRGKNCSGDSSITKPCTAPQNCAVDGVWEAWSTWSACSAICNGGFQIRRRHCYFPFHAPQGDYCVGRGTGTQPCNTQNCTTTARGEWGQWTAWIGCSSSCGTGTKKRYRDCLFKPVPYCLGVGRETTVCNSNDCPVDGKWGQWKGWSACSSSCGTGTKMRYRDCVYERTGPHRADCQGPDQEGTFCSTNACPVDGVWSQWTDWGDCSVTCDTGVQGRTRTCSYSDPTAPRGKKCLGPSFDTKLCTLKTCKEGRIRDCKDVLDRDNNSRNGLHRIDIGQTKDYVVCDMTTSGGGWTVLMYRTGSKVDFLHRDSNDYALGFGDKDSDFWQGLEDMHAITSDGRRYQLFVELQAANRSFYYALYDDFSIGPAKNFTLHVGNYRGTAGDSLTGHNGYGFTTSDRDVDSNPGYNCATYLGGSWWFHDCYDSCLTCEYVLATPGTQECASMAWNSMRYCEPLRMAKMMIRPM